jgi:hypothetical protein
MLAILACAVVLAIVLALREDEERRNLVLILVFGLCVIGLATTIGAL